MKRYKQIIRKKKEKSNTSKIEKEDKDENQNEKKIADPKQNKPPLKSIVVYHGTNQGGDMESNKACPNIESRKSLYIFFNQRFLQQLSLLGIDSVTKFAPKEWLNHSYEIKHPFPNKLKKTKNEAIE